MNACLDVIQRFQGMPIAVLGDLVADVYLVGTTNRISREAPVLIVREESRVLRPGGAANVVANLQALGAAPLPVGLLGDDGPGVQLLDAFAGCGVDTRGLVIDPARFTTTKTRVLAGGQNTVRQQMLRVDRVCDDSPGREACETLLRNLSEAVAKARALVVSDYGEGVLGEPLLGAVREIAKTGMPVFADSRNRIREFQECEALTPNEPELFEATGVPLSPDGLERAGRELLQSTRCRALVVKRGRNGMALFLPARPTRLEPPFGSTEVADVTGAGDTVLAVFALARGSGAEPETALRLANVAGGLKVTKSGTAVVSVDELRRALEGLA